MKFGQRAYPGDPLCVSICSDTANANRESARHRQFGMGSRDQNDPELFELPETRSDFGSVFLVNKTGQQLVPGNIVELGDAYYGWPSDDNSVGRDRMIHQPTFEAIVPTDAGKPFAIVARPMYQEERGIGCISGGHFAIVDVTNANHRFAVSIVGDVTKLESADSSRCEILGVKTAAVAETEAFVRISNDVTKKALLVKCKLSGALATTDASIANNSVVRYWGGGSNPGATVTLYNEEKHAAGTYLHTGAANDIAVATYDEANDKYHILGVQCS